MQSKFHFFCNTFFLSSLLNIIIIIIIIILHNRNSEKLLTNWLKNPFFLSNEFIEFSESI